MRSARSSTRASCSPREAKKKSLDKNADIKNQIDLASQTVLVRAFVSDWVKANPIPDAALRKEYDSDQGADRRQGVQGPHILVEKEDEAKEIIVELQKGGKFEKLAGALQGFRLQGQRRRPRLECAGQFRQAVLRRDGQLPKGKFTDAARADAIRLARDR